MNKARRDALDKLYSTIEATMTELETIRDGEQEAFDNMPESLQSSERGEQSQTAIDELQTATDTLNDVLAAIETAKGE